MLRFVIRSVLFLVLLLAGFSGVQTTGAQDPVDCDDFDAWSWAQSVFVADPEAFAGLDPDGNGIACEHLPIEGVGPVAWTDRIPDDAVPARLVSITDGDTFRVTIDGREDVIRMYHMNTPEMPGPYRAEECGAEGAKDYLQDVFGLVPDGTVYLEYDETKRDTYDRRLAYVWFELGGEVYMVNEAMVRSGWAESVTYEPDLRYRDQLNEAEQFSVEHVLGVRLQCGRFGQDVGAGPSNEQVRKAMSSQPDQGQFDRFYGPVAGSGNEVIADDVTGEWQAPTNPETAPVTSEDCDPSYPDFCILPAWQVGDLDCGDVDGRRFTVFQPDPHGFDGDGDGIGCER